MFKHKFFRDVPDRIFGNTFIIIPTFSTVFNTIIKTLSNIFGYIKAPSTFSILKKLFEITFSLKPILNKSGDGMTMF